MNDLFMLVLFIYMVFIRPFWWLYILVYIVCFLSLLSFTDE